MKLTPERIAEARARCEKASKGPWAAQEESCRGCREAHAAGEQEEPCEWYVTGLPHGSHGQIERGDDARFVSAARTDLSDALDDLAEARAALLQCVRAIMEWGHNNPACLEAAHWPQKPRPENIVCDPLAGPARRG